MIEFVTKGRRLYGAFIQLSTCLVYVAFRKPKDLYKGTVGKFKTLTAAVQDETAAWAIDEATLRQCRTKDVKFVAVWVKQLGWLFMTNIQNYQDREKSYSRNYSSRGGELQRFLPCKFFETRDTVLKI